MRTFLKILAVFGCGVLAFALWVLAFFVIGSFDDDWVIPDPLFVAAMLSPFLGAGVGGWLVSRRSTRRGKVGWILGGGLGIGALATVATLYLVAWFIIQAMEGIYGGGGYCC